MCVLRRNWHKYPPSERIIEKNNILPSHARENITSFRGRVKNTPIAGSNCYVCKQGWVNSWWRNTVPDPVLFHTETVHKLLRFEADCPHVDYVGMSWGQKRRNFCKDVYWTTAPKIFAPFVHPQIIIIIKSNPSGNHTQQGKDFVQSHHLLSCCGHLWETTDYIWCQ